MKIQIADKSENKHLTDFVQRPKNDHRPNLSPTTDFKRDPTNTQHTKKLRLFENNTSPKKQKNARTSKTKNTITAI